MYADRYSRRTKFDPGSMGLALLLNGTIVAGLVAFAAPKMFHRHIDPDITTFDVPPARLPPPPVDEVKPKVDHQIPNQKIDVVIPETVVITPIDDTHYIVPPTEPTPIGTGGGGGGSFVTPVKPPPITTGAKRDSRFVGNFQPDYPADERRAGHEGRVVVSVLIGVDGRVKQVKRVSAASDSFFEATERRALDKWRFKPGTRDGVPIETWEEVGVRFVLNNE